MSERRTPTERAGAQAHPEPPLLPDVTVDELDEGWTGDPDEWRAGRSDEWYLRERPPHHE